MDNRAKRKKPLDAGEKADYSKDIAVPECSGTANRKKGGRDMKYTAIGGNAEMNNFKENVQTVCLAWRSER